MKSPSSSLPGTKCVKWSASLVLLKTNPRISTPKTYVHCRHYRHRFDLRDAGIREKETHEKDNMSLLSSWKPLDFGLSCVYLQRLRYLHHMDHKLVEETSQFISAAYDRIFTFVLKLFLSKNILSNLKFIVSSCSHH
jgi:hypothetical protein